ncbi:MAG: hypothetical protein KGI50_07025 [Patescibacteria group bacterium]|nr:hypothetical protein [Patescibacteria group bacterium]MDE2439223.1 hypothetical protein [Patescibacteria group bacterium]
MLDGTYQCRGQVQDGMETWIENNFEVAVRSMKDFAKIINGTKIKRKDITFLQQPNLPPVPWKP